MLMTKKLGPSRREFLGLNTFFENHKSRCHKALASGRNRRKFWSKLSRSTARNFLLAEGTLSRLWPGAKRGDRGVSSSERMKGG